MTRRFQEELALKGQDWSDQYLTNQAPGYYYEQIAPDETVVAQGLVTPAQKKQIKEEFLASNSGNVIVFYPLTEEDISAINMIGSDV